MAATALKLVPYLHVAGDASLLRAGCAVHLAGSAVRIVPGQVAVMTGIFTVLRARIATDADLNASPRVFAILRLAGFAAADGGGWNRREPEPR